MTLTPIHQKIQKLRDNFELYARKNLKIKTKDGKIAPFELNQAQQYIHRRLTEQLRTTGKIRAIILKGRQQGCSTYTEGRFYWRVSMNKGKRAFILTHEEDATKNLFEMAQRYHDYSEMKPSTKASNAKELDFDRLQSGYRVGTAGNKSVGRSSTIQYFHGSEVAFWPHADEHAKGVLQAVPNAEGTEIILESTANGMGNFFHQQWKMAEHGISQYIAIFVPWYWQDEYRESVEDIDLTDEEIDLKEVYELDDEQIAWRRMKIIELSVGGSDGEKAFMQEYPMNAAEAFQVTGGDGLIAAHDALAARKREVKASGPLIVGVDPSRGGDRFTIMKRRGRKAYGAEKYSGDQVNTLGKMVSKCVRVLQENNPDKMFIDAGGGADLVDRLHELGYSNVTAIAFASSPMREDKYKNKRCEMWGDMAEWLKDEHLPPQIPDDDEIQADLCASPYERDSHDRIILWKKDKIKKEYGFSPDFGDALALTFAYPVRITETERMPNDYGFNDEGNDSWKTA